VSIRALAGDFGRLLDREPIIVGEEAQTALLSNASKCHELYGPPDVELDELIKWTAHWVKSQGPTLAKPTHFQTRNGKF
jgi:nucleoside-diphosphate-sugar epimerase